jgi:carboxylesterase
VTAPHAPFLLEAGPTGVLLIHGLTGSPDEMRPLGEHLHQQGHTVHGVLVAGHGACRDTLRASTWTDWYASAEAGLDVLHARCEQVVVVGFSMGAMLATRLSVRRQRIAGLVSMAPALWLHVPAGLAGVLRHVLRDVPHLGVPTAAVHELSRLQQLVRGDLANVAAPLLVLQGRRDRLVSPRGAAEQLRHARSPAKSMVWLERSGHPLPVDVDQAAVFEHTAAFVSHVTRAQPEPA